ncbi:hypothetical protein HDU91_000805 [Kappamyces sp. JEL0680]|nr:hypothetical protein HDU91_000805 [Kappamyces sp. JEL0680]
MSKYLVEEQILEAIADTFIGKLDEKEIQASQKAYFDLVAPELAISPGMLKDFYEFHPSSQKGTGALMLQYIRAGVPVDKIDSFLTVLRLLNTRFGTFLLCGYLTPFKQLSRKERGLALKAFEKSFLPDLQILFHAFLSVSALYGFGVGSVDSPNPTWSAMKYSTESVRPLQAQAASDVFRPKFVDVTGVSSLEYDIVIVGSGCGGGLMAAELTKDGYSVLLCEKASYQHNSEYKYSEQDAFNNLFEKRGAFQTEDGSLTILAGSAWGGGSAINWSASFQPPEKLRREWANVYGLQHVLEPSFQEGVDVVWRTLEATKEGIVHNTPNQILMDGCKKLGLKAEDINQNTGGQPHECAQAASRGCHFLDNIWVDKVLSENGAAKGIVGIKDGKKIVITAKKAVVVSCGSLQTPALLKRSFKKLNKHVGKHLRLHPVAVVSGVFPKQDILPSRGSIMTSVLNHSDANGYGYKLEVPSLHPAINSVAQKWDDAESFKRRLLLWPHTASIIILTRDKDSEGDIWIDKAGQPRVNWALGAKDEKSMLQGVEESIRILLAAGATEVYTNQQNVPSYHPDPKLSFDEIQQSAAFQQFVKQVHSQGALQLA